jgi:hypothetical protein
MTKSLSDSLYKGVAPIENGGTGANTASGALVKLGIHPKLVSGTNIKTVNNTNILFSSIQFGNLIPTSIKTANYTAVSNDLVRCNSTAGAFTITLPTSPNDGTIIAILDVNGTFSTYAVTVVTSGNTFENDTSIILNMPNTYISIIFNSFNSNWQIIKTKSALWYKSPEPPTGVSATASNLIAYVVFTSPLDNGGVPIKLYTATSSTGNLTGTLAQSGSGTITVTGLSYNTNYTFTVTASNGTDTSVPSNTSNIVALNKPNPPSIGTVTVSNVTITVPVVAPLINGGVTITQYAVTSSPAAFTGSLVQAGSGNVIFTATETQINTAYTFTVTATNAAGTSDASSASNSVTPSLPAVSSVTYIVVGGGGQGGYGNYHGGGGGGGGVLTGTLSVSGGTGYGVAVGAGGNNRSSSGSYSGSGSGFHTISTTGGGAGATQPGTGGYGGSGGGAPGNSGTPKKGTGVAGPPRQGYDGGEGSNSSPYYGAGGGGGFSGTGGTGGSTSGGAGGYGMYTNEVGWVASGGGGSAYTATGGSGGPGAGSGSQSPAGGAGSAATVNRGGGGGGSEREGSDQYGGAGGSGIVIITYPSTYRPATPSGSPTVSNDGTTRTYIFTGSGSITF